MEKSSLIIMSPIYFKGVKTNYCINSKGDVFRKRQGKPLKKLKPRIDKDGYLRITIYVNGKPYERGIHRLVALAFISNPENKPEVNHIDGNKKNNDAINLEWSTAKENIQHAWKHNLATAKKSEDHPNSIYTNNQIIQVCKLLEQNSLTMKEIANITSVSYTVVKQIKNRCLWTHISKNFDFSNYNMSKKSSTISEKDAKYICKLLSEHKTINYIHKLTNIKKKTITSIKNRKIWANVSKAFCW